MYFNFNICKLVKIWYLGITKCCWNKMYDSVSSSLISTQSLRAKPSACCFQRQAFRHWPLKRATRIEMASSVLQEPWENNYWLILSFLVEAVLPPTAKYQLLSEREYLLYRTPTLGHTDSPTRPTGSWSERTQTLLHIRYSKFHSGQRCYLWFCATATIRKH